MSSSIPSVMVSSTFYDLRQIRADLADFIEGDLGYHALLSEYPSFPVDPDVDTIENCRRRVEQNADILVLIVGGRYGHVPYDMSRSVTNLEYLYARVKGIPVFVFIDKAVLALLGMWKSNPGADFSSMVEDVRVFGFIQDIRENHGVWTHEFERAQDIILALRQRLSNLMQNALGMLAKSQSAKSRQLSTLRGRALRLALEQPEAWEYRLFAQVLTDEIDNAADLRADHRYGIAFGMGEEVELSESSRWMRARNKELVRLVTGMETIVNIQLAEAFGPSGVPGNAEAIIFAGRKLAGVYRSALEWSKRVHLAHFDDCMAPVTEALSQFADDIIERLESLGPESLAAIEQALTCPDPNGKTVRITITPTVRNFDKFNEAIKRAEKDCFGSV